MIVKDSNSSRVFDIWTSFEVTSANGCFVEHQLIASSTVASSPSKTASTRPSGEFLTHPVRPSDCAQSRVCALKKTPWTRPEKNTWARTFTDDVYPSAVKKLSLETLFSSQDLRFTAFTNYFIPTSRFYMCTRTRVRDALPADGSSSRSTSPKGDRT
jgi:hypothetical protein